MRALLRENGNATGALKPYTTLQAAALRNSQRQHAHPFKLPGRYTGSINITQQQQATLL